MAAVMKCLHMKWYCLWHNKSTNYDIESNSTAVMVTSTLAAVHKHGQTFLVTMQLE